MHSIRHLGYLNVSSFIMYIIVANLFKTQRNKFYRSRQLFLLTERLTLLQRAIAKGHSVCPSVRLSVRLSVCPSVCRTREPRRNGSLSKYISHDTTKRCFSFFYHRIS